jgi:SAM-dependent methyltransferase
MSGYAAHAPYYDLIYAFKDYRAEADALIGLLAAEGIESGRLLDAGCGTGSHLAQLRDRFEVAGFDGEPGMLEVARRKLPDVRLWQADLTDFVVEQPYDAVICMFGAIGHVYPEDRLREAVRRLAAALRPGGVLALEPWLNKETIDLRGRAGVNTHADPDHALAVSRVIVSRVEGELSVLETAWTVGRRGEPIHRFDEQLRLWLCPPETMQSALVDAGLEPKHVAFGRSGLWIGRKT